MDLNIGRQRDHLRLARWVKPTQITFKSRELSPAEVREKQQKGIYQRGTQPTFAGRGHMKNIRSGQPLGQRPAPGKEMGFSLTTTTNQIQPIT